MENRNNLCDDNNLVISRTVRQEPVHRVVYRLLRRETYKKESLCRILYVTVIFILRITNISVAIFKNHSIRSIFIGITMKRIAEIETAYLTHTFQVGTL